MITNTTSMTSDMERSEISIPENSYGMKLTLVEREKQKKRKMCTHLSSRGIHDSGCVLDDGDFCSGV